MRGARPGPRCLSTLIFIVLGVSRGGRRGIRRRPASGFDETGEIGPLLDTEGADVADRRREPWEGLEGYDPAYGARPLKRVISRLVVDPLARMLLTGEIRDGSRVSADVGKDGLAFRVVAAKDKKKEEDAAA